MSFSVNQETGFNVSREDKNYLVLVCLASALIKLFLITQTEIINPDGIRYINSANELFQGNLTKAFNHEKMLAFTFVVGLVHSIIPDWFMAGKVVSSLSLVLTTVPLYFISRDLFNRRVAVFTVLVFTVAPVINGKADAVLKDPPFLLLLTLALWFALRGLNEQRWLYLLFSCIAACLATTFRIEGIVFLLAVTLFLSSMIIFKSEGRALYVKFLAAFTVVPLVAFCTVCSAYALGLFPDGFILELKTKFGAYFSTDLTSNYKNIYNRLKEVEYEFPGGQWTNDLFEIARSNMYLVYLIGLLQVFLKGLFPVFLVPLWFGLRVKKNFNPSLALHIFALISYLLMGYFFLMTRNFISGRYLLVPIVLTFPFIGLGLDVISNFVRSARFHKSLIFLAVLLCILLPVGRTFSGAFDEKIEIKHAGEWLRKNIDLSHRKLMVNGDRAPFYAGLFADDYELVTFKNSKQYENKALLMDRDLMVIEFSPKRTPKLPVFDDFKLVQSFRGRKKVLTVYERKL